MKKIRLDEKAYQQKGQTNLITICTANRLDLFSDEKFVNKNAETLKQVASKYEFTTIIYCFMPDHIHILLYNTSGLSIVEFVRDLKYKCTREAWNHGYEGIVFQKSFHDHFLRKAEDLKTTIDYIYQNPVRKGLPEERIKPPFVGSDLFDF